VRTLAARDRGEFPLIAVLGYNNPSAAVAAVEGLIQLGRSAVQPLMEQLDEYNYGARAYAIRALAAIADPRLRCISQQLPQTSRQCPSRRCQGTGNLALEPVGCRSALLRSSQSSADAAWGLPRPRLVDSYAAVVGLQALSRRPI